MTACSRRSSWAPAARRPGYRLQRLEVFNWGTFDKRVWRLSAGGATALLTGDIGSGKSTLVDALSTLLLPAHRIAYNKAAGADARERTLRSYVEGHYKSERVEATGTSRPVGLRDHRHYSVILGVFANDGFDESITLAQVFHQKDRAGQPDRFFVTSQKQLSIETDFTDFGSDLTDLRRRLRAGGAEIHTVFPDYARRARRLLGIKSEQAMELFHQTVSMKSVGNLNEFVRSHMLEPADAADKVRDIVAHFEDLTKAHDAVKRAREQLDALQPLVASSKHYDGALGRRGELEQQRDAVRLFIAELRVRLLTEEIVAHEVKRDRQTKAAEAAREICDALVRERESLIIERAAAGGDRLSQLEEQIRAARTLAAERRQRRQDLDTLTRTARLPGVTDLGGIRGARRRGGRRAHATGDRVPVGRGGTRSRDRLAPGASESRRGGPCRADQPGEPEEQPACRAARGSRPALQQSGHQRGRAAVCRRAARRRARVRDLAGRR